MDNREFHYKRMLFAYNGIHIQELNPLNVQVLYSEGVLPVILLKVLLKADFEI